MPLRVSQSIQLKYSPFPEETRPRPNPVERELATGPAARASIWPLDMMASNSVKIARLVVYPTLLKAPFLANRLHGNLDQLVEFIRGQL